MTQSMQPEEDVLDRLRTLGARLRFRKSGRIHTVDLSEQTMIGDDWVEQLSPLSSLAVLILAGSDITDEAVNKLAAFPKLESLDLQNTAVSDACLPVLQSLQQLKILVLTATRVSSNGLKLLRKSMLNTRIISL